MNVLVTGASSGYGAAIATRFAREGHHVIAAGRRTERLRLLQTEFGEGLIHPLTVDVRDLEAVTRALESLGGDLSRIDVLVNNAGLALGTEPAHEADMAGWELMIDTNIKGLVYLTRALLPGMVSLNKGHIINIGSTAASYPYPGANVYGATKAFVQQFTLNLRADLLSTQIRVTNIEPGLSEGTEFSSVRFRGDEKRVQSLYLGANALKADDIAEAVFWAVTLPSHVNVNVIELMPVTQAFAALPVHRELMPTNDSNQRTS